MANPQESALHYPLGDTLPAPGSTVEVAPGVRWLRMALPFALDHVNLWLLRDALPDPSAPGGERQGWTVVDCGIDDAATRAAWEHLFATELQGLPVLRVVVTHMHPDHIGLAHWICERWSTAGSECRLWISATDWNVARLALQPGGGFGGPGAARFYARHGLTDADTLAQITDRGAYFSSLVPAVPRTHRRLLHGMRLLIGGRDWHCIVGYGHAPEHIALHCPELNVLIAGDMVLPRISTNVSVHELEPEADPLTLYLASIDKLLALPADTLVLPSHGKPFSGLHQRIGQLAAHHADRFADVLAACADRPQSAAALLPVLFRRQLDAHQMTFAMGESVAHLHALQSQGLLAPVAAADGTLRFGRVGAG